MKTIINNINRGFRSLRIRFDSEIWRFLNDFFDFSPFFPQKIEKWSKMHTFLTLVWNRLRQICQDISDFVELFVLYKFIILSLAGKLWKKVMVKILKKNFYTIFQKRFAKGEMSLLNMSPNMLQEVLPCEL